MKTIICITLIFHLFLSISASANTCTPTVSNGKVLIEVINGDGKTVYSKQHQVRNEKKYSGLISSSKIYNLLKHDKSGEIQVDKSKLNIAAGGMTTKTVKKDGSAIAKIGGCSISEVTLFTRLGKQKDPFVHNDVIIAAKNSSGEELKLATQSKSKEKPSPATIAAKNSSQSNIQILSKGYKYDPKRSSSKNELKFLHKKKIEFSKSTSTSTCYISNNSPDLKGIRIGDKANKVISEIKIPDEFPKNSKWQYKKAKRPPYDDDSISLLETNGGVYVWLTATLNDNKLVKEVSFEQICSKCNVKEIEGALIQQLGKPDKSKSQGTSKHIVWHSKERGYGYSMTYNAKSSTLTLKLGAYCDRESVNKVKKSAAEKPKSAASKLTPAKTFKNPGNSFGSKIPTSKDAENYLGYKAQSESKGRISLIKFSKLDGLKKIDKGVEYYTMDFSAIIQFEKDCRWVTGHMGEFEGFETVPVDNRSGGMAGYMAGFSNPGTNVKKGLKSKLTGKIIFQKAEKGWRVLRLKVNKRVKIK